MKFLDLLLHFLTPRYSNSHRAKALSIISVTGYIIILLVFQVFLSAISHFEPGVLGYASNINAADLLKDTNERRAEDHIAPLLLNSQLNNAAAGKAADMFTKQYWAHISPDGKTPWDFITGAGYNYVFAGENLARDFGDSKAVVDAWMNSPSHRENLLNDRFKDVGFAVVNGKYGGNETTLVVQEFGAKSTAAPTVAAPAKAEVQGLPVEQGQAEQGNKETASNEEATGSGEVVNQTASPPGMILNTSVPLPEKAPKIDVLGVTKSVSSGLTIFLIGVLFLDSLLVYRRQAVRISGHNFAHLLILMMILAVINLIGRGVVI